MLQHEFEQRVGYKVANDFYSNTIEPMYMAYEGDKDNFCEEYQKCFSKISKAQMENIIKLTMSPFVKEGWKTKAEIAELRFTVDEMVKDIATSAFEGNEDARRAIVYAKGWKTYLYLKTKNGYTLDSEEVAHLKDLLEIK